MKKILHIRLSDETIEKIRALAKKNKHTIGQTIEYMAAEDERCKKYLSYIRHVEPHDQCELMFRLIFEANK